MAWNYGTNTEVPPDPGQTLPAIDTTKIRWATQIQQKPFVDVREFGAKGDGVTDDSAAIQEAFDYGGNIEFPFGTYNISGTGVTIDPTKVFSVRMADNAYISYSGTGTAVTINGGDGLTNYPRRKRYEFNITKATEDWYAGSDTSSNGFVCINCREMDLVVGRIQNFYRAFHLTGYNAGGCGLNNIYLGFLRNNCIGLEFSRTGTGNGYQNNNSIYGGYIRNDSAYYPAKVGSKGIHLGVGSNNMNVFYNTDVENNTFEYNIDVQSSQNIFFNPRPEGASVQSVWFRPSSSYNTWIGGYLNTGVITGVTSVLKDEGYKNQVITPYGTLFNGGQRGSGNSSIIATIDNNPYYFGGTYVSGGTFTGSAGQYVTLTNFDGGGTSATGRLYLTGTDTVAAGSPIVMISYGNYDYTTAPTVADVGNGNATGSGTISMSMTIGTDKKRSFEIDNYYRALIGPGTVIGYHGHIPLQVFADASQTASGLGAWVRDGVRDRGVFLQIDDTKGIAYLQSTALAGVAPIHVGMAGTGMEHMLVLRNAATANATGMTEVLAGTLSADALGGDGDFSDALKWTISGAGISISDGAAHWSNSALSQNMLHTNVFTAGNTYRVTFTISNYVKGTLRLYVGGSGPAYDFTANGDYEIFVTPVSNVNTTMYWYSQASLTDTTLDLSNVVVNQVTGVGITTAGRLKQSGALDVPAVIVGTAAPSTTPMRKGDLFVDESAKKLYFAAGTTNSSDWIIAN